MEVPLWTSPSLSLTLSQGWEGKNITGNMSNQYGQTTKNIRIPLDFVVTNTSSDILFLPTPVVNEMYPAPPFLISCYDEWYCNSKPKEFARLAFTYSTYALKNKSFQEIKFWDVFSISVTGWTENNVWPLWSMESTMLWVPNSNFWIKDEWEIFYPKTINGSLTHTCGLFVNVLAWSDNCWCNDDTWNTPDMDCFKNCYPDLLSDNSNYTFVAQYTPSKYWIQVDEQKLNLNYTGTVIWECYEWCSFDVSFSKE
jgi:hypothetical protein